MNAAAALAVEPPAAALAVERLSLSFGGVTALADIDLRVAPGEIRAIIGPNGAGKSSLLNVISGLYRPQAGRVWLAGRAFDQVPTNRLAALKVARTFQNLALFKGLSVADNVAAGLFHLGRAGVAAQMLALPWARRDRAEQAARVRDVLAFLHLDRHADRPAGTLSYGLQKRVELARAVVARPGVLLLDEPMAGMTLTDKQELSAHIRAVRDQFGTAIVLIEHDIGVVMDLSDRVAVLDYGRKIADDVPARVAADPVVIDAYLGVAHDVDAGGGI